MFGKTGGTPVALTDLAMGRGGIAIDGEASNDRSGISVSGAGDVNDDTVPELLVGASEADPQGVTNAGRSYVIFE